jgi:16S rRNA (cytosine967-C5)-methyltransferase
MAKFDIEVKLALRLAAYQLLFLDRIPPAAAVNESVELVKLHGKRSAAPLVNAFLRKLSTSPLDLRTASAQSASEIAYGYSQPGWLVERWAAYYGSEAALRICGFNQQRPRTTVRITSPKVREEVAREGIDLEPGELVANAWHVVRGDVTASSAYREHRLPVQDEGSQLVALLAQGSSILDCCAAPGGKSAVAAEQNPSALVISADSHLHRVRLMQQLIGSHTAVVADARQLPLTGYFDCIIADLPCTGTGTLARNPEIKWRLKPDDLPRLAALQLEILESVAKVGRSIVYSTCSLEPEEGEEVITEFLSKHPEFRLLSMRDRLQQLAMRGAIRTEAVNGLARGDLLRTIPGIHKCDGFFAAILSCL